MESIVYKVGQCKSFQETILSRSKILFQLNGDFIKICKEKSNEEYFLEVDILKITWTS